MTYNKPENKNISTPEYRDFFLRKMKCEKMDEKEQRAYDITTAGAAMPESVADKFMVKMYQASPALELITNYHIPGRLQVSAYNSADEPLIHTENALVTPAGDAAVEITLEGFEILKIIKASKAVTTLSGSKFEDYLINALAPEMARKLEKIIFLANGSDQPKGVLVSGSGTDGAYVENTDMLTVAVGDTVSNENVKTFVGMVDEYVNSAVYMSKATFRAYFQPLMDTEGSAVRFFNGKYYLMDLPVSFTSVLSKGVAYAADLSQIVANYAADFVVSTIQDFTSNAVLHSASCIFDCAPVTGNGAFAKFVKAQE